MDLDVKDINHMDLISETEDIGRMDLMIDIETFGRGPTAPLVQIGAVPFEPKSGGRLRNDKGMRITISEPVGDFDGSTLAFWLQQPAAKRLGEFMQPSNGGLSLIAALTVFEDGIRGHGLHWPDLRVWACPAKFDLPILEHAFRLCGREAPWHHWNTMCAKALFTVVGGRPDVDKTGLIAHDGLDDALAHAVAVQKACKLLDRAL